RNSGDHVSAALIRRHSLEQPGLSIQHPDTCRSINLVTRECIEVTVEILDVNSVVRRRLSSIDHHRNISTVGQPNHLPSWIYRSQRIRDMRDRNEFRPFVDEVSKLI